MFPRYNRQVDGCPKSDIHRCNAISGTSIAARLASEIISGRSISLRDMSTRRTSPRSVTRIYKDHRNSCNLGFVVHKHPEQPKIPGMQAATLRPSNRGSLSNTLKIFESNRPKSVFGFRNKFPGNAMVNIFGEPGHSTRQLPQMAFSRFGSFALEPGFQGIKLISGLADLLARMHFSIAIYGQILDTKINTKNANRIIRRCFGGFNHYAKIEDTFNQDQISLSSNAVEPGLLIISKPDGNNLPTLESNQGNFFKSFPGENTLVIDNRPVKPKLRFDGLVSLVGFADLGNGPNRKLGRETKMLSNRIVYRLMDLNLVGTMQSKNCLCYVITSLVKPLHCFAEHFVLLGGGIEFYHQGLKHLIED